MSSPSALLSVLRVGALVVGAGYGAIKAGRLERLEDQLVEEWATKNPHKAAEIREHVAHAAAAAGHGTHAAPNHAH